MGRPSIVVFLLILSLQAIFALHTPFIGLNYRSERSAYGHVALKARHRPESGCPVVAPKPVESCAGRSSACWSPGVRDTDCPAHGLCCFDGCVNVCAGEQRSPPPPPPPPVRPKNPCSPSPCGPGTICTPSPFGNAICRCKPGLVAKVDTITGCEPECIRDSDCPGQLVCQNQQCIERPDPCDPSPCGPGADCMADPAGNAICRCEPGLIPDIDTINGCKPECIRDADCNHGYICQQQQCIEKPDPCDPSPCGQGADCMVNSIGNAICRCREGLIPMPDTIAGCGPECIRDPDCADGFICDNQRCIEKPDPCDPSPCGPGANCMVNPFGNPICRCNPGLIPMPNTIEGCKPECTRNTDCNFGFICKDQRCVVKPDPCNPSPCGPGANCMANSFGNPICRCEPGLIPIGTSIEGCKPECTRDPDCHHQFGSDYVCEQQRCVERPDPCDPSPCGPGTSCTANRFGNPVCECLGDLVPKPTTIAGCGPECEVDGDCHAGEVCERQKCVQAPDPCQPNKCGLNADCIAKGHYDFTCECPPGHVGNARVACHRGDCETDYDCADTEKCEAHNCRDACSPGICAKTDFCRAVRHTAICGFNMAPPKPKTSTTIVIGESYDLREPEETEPRTVIGGAYGRSAAPRSGRRPFTIGAREGWKGECSGGCRSAGTSRSFDVATIGAIYRRKKRALARRLLPSVSLIQMPFGSADP